MYLRRVPGGHRHRRSGQPLLAFICLFSFAMAVSPSNAPGFDALMAWLVNTQPDLVRARQELKLTALPWNGAPPAYEISSELILGNTPLAPAGGGVRIEGPTPASVAAASQAAHAARRRAETGFRLVWMDQYQALRDTVDSLRKAEEQEIVLRAEQARLRSVMENLQIRRAMGGARDREITRFRLELDALEQRIFAIQQDRSAQSSALEQLVGRPVAAAPTVDTVKSPPDIEDAFRSAEKGRPEQGTIALARDEVRWAAQRRGLAFVPAPGLGVTATATEFSLTAGAKWDLGVFATAPTRRAALERQGFDAERQALARRITNEVRAALRTWELCTRREQLSRASLEKTAALEQDGRMRFQEGLVTLTAFIEEQRALLDMKLIAVETRYELARAVTRLERQIHAPLRGLERFP